MRLTIQQANQTLALALINKVAPTSTSPLQFLMGRNGDLTPDKGLPETSEAVDRTPAHSAVPTGGGGMMLSQRSIPLSPLAISRKIARSMPCWRKRA